MQENPDVIPNSSFKTLRVCTKKSKTSTGAPNLKMIQTQTFPLHSLNQHSGYQVYITLITPTSIQRS